MVDLKGLLPKKDKTEHFWSIVLEKDWVQAGVWKTVEGKVVMVTVSPPTSWASAEELVDAVDTALSAAVSELADGISEPEKTVFAVPSSWVVDGQIKGDHLTRVKEICTKLELKPVGFVVLAEAISHYIKSEEDAAVSAVLIGLGKEQIELSLLREGKVVGSTEVLRSVSLPEDVSEGLVRIKDEEDLPSRIILYDGKDGELEEAKQSLILAKWDSGSIEFLHSPKVDFVDSKAKVFATALAGGTELVGATEVSEAAKAEVVDHEVKPVSEKEIDQTSDPLSLEETGFVVNQDVDTVSEPEIIDPVVATEKPTITEPLAVTKPILGKFVQRFGLLQGKVASLFGQKTAPKGPKKILFFGSLFAIALFVAGFFAWWFLPQAEVTIFISPNQLEEKVGIFVDPEADGVDLSTKTLPGEVLTEEVEGNKTASTTGTKTVGDKATGTVKLYRVGAKVDLPSGTVIEANNGLEFVLDNAISVASGSASSPSSIETTVTASAFGSDYNLASGESFSVSNYPTSELEAINDNSFSGGSSREISAVSESDLETLLTDLENELKEKAKEEFKKKVDASLGQEDKCSEGCVFIEDSVVSEVTEMDYSAKVGDEAETLKLDLTVTVTGLIVDKKSLIEVANETFKEKIPTGYVLREDQIKMRFGYDSEDDGKHAINVTVSANLLPELKVDEITKTIAGKMPEQARELLSQIPGFERLEIVLKPRLPGKLGSLPRLSKNIDIQVAAEQ